MFELVAISREHRKQRRQKVDNGDVIRVGRKPEDGFAVPWDNQISREHIELVIKSGKVVVKKLVTAQNDVHFNGKALQKFKLKPGDQFRIGFTTFQFHEQSEADSMVGENFGDFALSKRLGNGSLGVLYGASKRSSRLQAALRVLEPCLVNTSAMTEQFLNQGRCLCEGHRVVPCGRAERTAVVHGSRIRPGDEPRTTDREERNDPCSACFGNRSADRSATNDAA